MVHWYFSELSLNAGFMLQSVILSVLTASVSLQLSWPRWNLAVTSLLILSLLQLSTSEWTVVSGVCCGASQDQENQSVVPQEFSYWYGRLVNPKSSSVVWKPPRKGIVLLFIWDKIVEHGPVFEQHLGLTKVDRQQILYLFRGENRKKIWMLDFGGKQLCSHFTEETVEDHPFLWKIAQSAFQSLICVSLPIPLPTLNGCLSAPICLLILSVVFIVSIQSR